jgi:hypothetical protein
MIEKEFAAQVIDLFQAFGHAQSLAINVGGTCSRPFGARNTPSAVQAGKEQGVLGAFSGARSAGLTRIRSNRREFKSMP